MIDDPPPAVIPRIAYNVAEFGALFGKSRHWAHRLVQAGKVNVLRGYGGALIPVSEADRIVAEAKRQGGRPESAGTVD